MSYARLDRIKLLIDSDKFFFENNNPLTIYIYIYTDNIKFYYSVNPIKFLIFENFISILTTEGLKDHLYRF